MTDVERRVIKVVSDTIDNPGLTPATALDADDLDSLEDVGIAMGLEEEFDISIPDRDVSAFFVAHQPTVRHLVEWVLVYLRER